MECSNIHLNRRANDLGAYHSSLREPLLTSSSPWFLAYPETYGKESIKICGTCGILSDPIYTIGSKIKNPTRKNGTNIEMPRTGDRRHAHHHTNKHHRHHKAHVKDSGSLSNMSRAHLKGHKHII